MKIKGKTILVTGGAGFIGSKISKRLIQLGAEVIVIDSLNEYYDPNLKNDRLNILLRGLSFKFYKYDIANIDDLEKAFQENKIDLICHEAAQAGVRYSIENPFAYSESNLVGTLNIFEMARKYKVEGVVFASSSSVYGNNLAESFDESMRTDEPESLYAATKKSAELMAYSYHKLYGINTTALRYFTVYGPWGRPDMALFKFTKSILAGDEIEVYNNGELERDFTYIDDIVNGTVSALEHNYPFEIFNLGFGHPQKLMNFIGAVENSIGKKAKIKYLPHQKGDVMKTSANIEKAKGKLNWEPKVSMEIGVKNFVDWYKKYYKV